MIGKNDQANHEYDTSDFFAAVAAGNLPAVSFIKAPAYEDAHPGNSDPISEEEAANMKDTDDYLIWGGRWKLTIKGHLIDPRAPVRWRRPRWAARVQVEMQAVLDRLWLGHALEINARTIAARINDRARVIPLFFRDTVLGQPFLPRGGGLGRSFQLVAERIGPEPGYYRGI